MNRWFRLAGRLEGVSFLLLLLIAMPLKYYANFPLGVKVLGPAHGILFLAYCGFAMSLALTENWPLKKHMFAYLAAVFPCGTFLYEKFYLQGEINNPS